MDKLPTSIGANPWIHQHPEKWPLKDEGQSKTGHWSLKGTQIVILLGKEFSCFHNSVLYKYIFGQGVSVHHF